VKLSPLAVSLSALALVAACGGGDEATSSTPFVPKKVTIAYSSDPQSMLLTEIYAKALENSGTRIARKQTKLDRNAALKALEAGEIQLYIDYSSGLLLQLDPQADVSPSTSTSTTTLPADATTTAPTTVAIDPSSTTSATTTTLSPLQKALPAGVTAGAPSNADIADVIACKLPEGSTVTTLSGLAEVDQDLRLAAPAEFATATPFGAATLKERYGIEFKEIVTTTPDQFAAAITDGKAECIVASGINTTISTATLTVLADDLGLQPQQLAVPLLASSVAPDLSFTVDAVSGLLDTATVRSMMSAIDQGVPVSSIVEQFLSGGQ
jgi:osmoprotectant transport system substrate-binding protein